MKKSIEKFEIKKLSLKSLNSVLGAGTSSTGDTVTNSAGDSDSDTGSGGVTMDHDIPPPPTPGPVGPKEPTFEM